MKAVQLKLDQINEEIGNLENERSAKDAEVQRLCDLLEAYEPVMADVEDTA